MEVVAVLSSQQWQLFFSSMTDMPAARQHAGEFIIMAVVAVLSSQQWQLFFSSMTDMLAALQPAGEFMMALLVAVLFAAMAADLQQRGRYSIVQNHASSSFLRM